MATWADVGRLVAELPDTGEVSGRDGLPAWQVHGKTFVWERPLRKADLGALGAAAPDGPILGAYVPDVGAKEALVADDPGVYFTTPHFDGYPVVLVQLDRATETDLRELVTEAWLVRAPKRLAKAWLAERQSPE
jgi:hypothetical protein